MMARHVPLLLYFDGSVNGLAKGSAVKFKGVPIGYVEAVLVHYKQVPGDMAVDSQALGEEAERGLQRALMDLRGPVLEASGQRRYADSLHALVGLRGPVNDFFDRVMVMDENTVKRNNRLALLRDVQILLGGVADLSRLPG